MLVTLKHFTGHGWPENGTNVGPAHLGERELREDFFPPFEAAVKTFPIQSVMASYNEIDGIPSHANSWLLNDVLRREWGYKGAVVSDYYGIRELVTRHHLYGNVKDAAERAIKSGVDVETPDPEGYVHLPELVREGRVPMALIDQAVRRVLTLKFDAGLFENPYPDPATAEAKTATPDAIALAREAADKAIILFKNDQRTAPARLRQDPSPGRARYPCQGHADRRVQRRSGARRQRPRRDAGGRSRQVRGRLFGRRPDDARAIAGRATK